MADLNGRNLACGWQGIVDEGAGERIAVVIVDHVLVEHAADSLDHSAEDLSFHDLWIDHSSAVLADDVAQDPHAARVDIDLTGADVARVGEREWRRLEAV